MALLALTAPDPPRGSAEDAVVPEQMPSVITELRGLLTNFAYVGTVVGYIAYTFALGGLQLWMPKFLSEVRGLELARANFIVGGLTVVAGLSGTFMGGYLGDLVSARIKHGQLWLSGLSSVAGIVPTWLALSITSAPSYLVWLFIAEFLLFLSTGPVNVVLVSVVPIRSRAMAMAMSIFAIHLLGDAISPPIVGWLADMSGLASAVLIMPVAIALSGLVWCGTAATSRA
jgi:MFS family permease